MVVVLMMNNLVAENQVTAALYKLNSAQFT